MKNYQLHLQSGLTLVETLVAITVLIVGVIGPLSIAAQGIGDGIFARNQIAANYLAQEALEVVINKRYAAIRQVQYAPGDWTAIAGFGGVNGCLTAGSGARCRVDAKTGTVTADCLSASDLPNCELVFNTSSGLYQKPTSLAAGDVGPIFTRYLQMSPDSSNPPNKIKVTATITWNNKDVPKSLTISEDLFSQG